MSGMVCYFERAAGGSALRRVRLVGAAFDRSWTAPGASGEVVSGAGDGRGAAVSGVRAGARWVAETLRSLGVSRLDVLALDAEGGVCTWLSAPSPDQRMVAAAVQQAALGGVEGAGGSAARLIATGIVGGDSIGFGGEGDVSLQALAADDAPPSGGRGLRLSGRRAGAGIGEQRQRFGVISVRDAAARVFIDELDARGIEVGSVCSTWHAIGAAWDPAAPRPGEEPADNAATCAVVMTDPAGRIVWAWSSAGEVVAAGTVRLRHIAHRVQTPAAPQAGALAVRGDDEAPAEVSGLECTGADVGRLVMDWLSWSAQLGRSPDRIVCIGPATLPGQPAASGQDVPWLGGPAPMSVAEGLGRAWQGATIDAAVHEDPIGATLTRLAGVGPVGARPADAARADDDPRRELLTLSARPGRSDRWMYRWMAAGLLAAGAAVAVVGWRFHQSASEARGRVDEARSARKALLTELDALVPGVSNYEGAAAIGRLQGKAAELDQVNKSLRAQRPILQELERVLLAIGATEGVRLTDINMNAAVGSVRLRVPDGEAGPAIFDRVTASPYPGCMPWRGSTPSLPLSGEDRAYVLTGSWPSEAGGRP
ncbi:MAG: hypothetical protein KF699_11250 [Phycisphaeraceae bacterium]|nr:hypothetical protein [Phycisphaeraceae bacterium]